MKEICDYKIDFSKTIVSLKNFVYYVAYEDKSFYKYYHSDKKTDKFEVSILVYSRESNSIINTISFSISKSDYENKKNELLYCPINNVGILIQETMNSESKIIHILYCNNLEDKNHISYFKHESRLHKIPFKSCEIKKIDSVKGKLTLKFIDQNTMNYKEEVIFNISEKDYNESIFEIALGLVEWRENGKDEWRNSMNIESRQEIEKFNKTYSIFLPYVIFRKEEWDNKKIFIDEESLREILDKFKFDGEPSQEIKNEIVIKIRQKKSEKRKCYNDEDFTYPNSKTWLEDAAGTNDPETLNDVFWNLD